MKKFTFLSFLLLTTLAEAQIFTDDFESYATGSYIGPQSTYWRTWSAGGEGTPEDVQTTSVQANSGTHSIYFSSTATNGGPQDVLLDFVQLYNSGVFTWGSSFYINPNQNAYFNFQGSNSIGQTFTMEVYMQNGTITIQNQADVKLTTPYPAGAWFDMEIVANLTTKIWELKMDGQSVGKWTANTNSVRYVDYYPINGSQFYVDDVYFDHAPYTPSALNAATASLTLGSNFANTNGLPSLTVVNTGNSPITSLMAELNYNGNSQNVTLNGLSLAPGASTQVDFAPISIVSGLSYAWGAIQMVNGMADDNQTDDTTFIISNPIIPAAGKMVVSEEGTGTWCQWCPRGAVSMERFENEYGSLGLWAGIAVHNSDPMDIGDYDAQLAFAGYPSSKVDRGTAVDPSDMYPFFEQRVQIAPKALIEVGANWNASTRQLQVSGEFDFQQAVTQNYRVAIVLTEDSVTGTTSQYNQANAYAGGGQGPMGGYELLPNPVPASMMVYDHVARDIKPSFSGFTGAFPPPVAAGAVLSAHYTFTLPASWDADKIHIVVMLIAPNGTIDNAGKATISEAVTNGFTGGTNMGADASLTDLHWNDAAVQLYPNPAYNEAHLVIQTESQREVEVRLLDMSGKTISARMYNLNEGAHDINIPTAQLLPGVYQLQLVSKEGTITKKLIVR